MEGITLRFLKLIEELISQGVIKDKADFAKSVGVSVSSLTEISKGRSNVGLSTIQKTVSVFPEVSLDWLIEGKGKMFARTGTGSDKIKYPTSPGKTYLAGEPKSQKKSFFSTPDTTTIPIVGISAMAGTGALNPDYVSEQDSIQLPSRLVKSGTHHCIRIKGMSMSPTLQDGGYLISRLLERSEWVNIKNEYIYVVTNREGETFIKRLKNRLKDHGLIVCMSDNPDKVSFPNFNLDQSEIHNIWEVEWYLSAKMPNIHDTYYNRLKDMEEDIDELKSFMSRLLTQPRK